MERSEKLMSDKSNEWYLVLMSVAALGVVYGDIGTSPLYAFRECFSKTMGLSATPANIEGVLSLICWSLILVISIKYLVFILRADNNGEGGILALTALIKTSGADSPKNSSFFIMAGLFGAALLYGESMITPAISVLSAVEGLAVATPFFEPFIIPLTIVLLVVLFFLQHRGTARIGAVFGPLILVWFLVIGILGFINIVKSPDVLQALNPLYAVRFFIDNGSRGFFMLGAVCLVITGGEALYVDMGHFGTKPVRTAWFSVVLIALLLNYFGQGALLLHNPGAVVNPFYYLAPAWAMYPLVIIAATATVIASQAVVSGAFSLTMQAVQLGYSPRLSIEHTSKTERGQVYLPFVNKVLMVCCIGLVLEFRSSDNLAAAYGIAVTTAMAITTVLFFVVARSIWNWALWKVMLICGFFLCFDLSFCIANIAKVIHGGWFPLFMAGFVFILFTTWKWGRGLLSKRFIEKSMSISDFFENMKSFPPVRVPGTAVFMSSNPMAAPSALLHNIKHNHVLHETVIVIYVETLDIPHVSYNRKVEWSKLVDGAYQMIIRFGFMENPDVPEALKSVSFDGWTYDPIKTTFFLGRESLLPGKGSIVTSLRKNLFMFMSRNAITASDFFSLPSNRVVELGVQIRL